MIKNLNNLAKEKLSPTKKMIDIENVMFPSKLFT